MTSVVVLAEGRVKDQPTRALLNDYQKRIAKYLPFSEVEVDADIEARADKLLGRDGVLVALEVLGDPWSSHELANRFRQWQNRSTSKLVFVIGGAYGLPKTLSERASARWSLSNLTLPHRLARIVVFEQLYRAQTILRNEPYSH